MQLEYWDEWFLDILGTVEKCVWRDLSDDPGTPLRSEKYILHIALASERDAGN